MFRSTSHQELNSVYSRHVFCRFFYKDALSIYDGIYRIQYLLINRLTTADMAHSFCSLFFFVFFLTSLPILLFCFFFLCGSRSFFLPLLLSFFLSFFFMICLSALHFFPSLSFSVICLLSLSLTFFPPSLSLSLSFFFFSLSFGFSIYFSRFL